MHVDSPQRTLYTYWRSSAAYRVRIALNLKGLTYEAVPINLLMREHWDRLYGAMNPQKLVPAFLDGTSSSDFLSQSLAIIEYLDEQYKNPPLLPRTTPETRALTRQLACIIACDVHPLNTPRVKEYLTDEFDVSGPTLSSWSRTWVYRGFDAYEILLERNFPNSFYSCGDFPTIADCCLIPQVYSAKRLNCDMKSYPIINRVYDACMKLDSFKRAAPENQPDVVLES